MFGRIPSSDSSPMLYATGVVGRMMTFSRVSVTLSLLSPPSITCRHLTARSSERRVHHFNRKDVLVMKLLKCQERRARHEIQRRAHLQTRPHEYSKQQHTSHPTPSPCLRDAAVLRPMLPRSPSLSLRPPSHRSKVCSWLHCCKNDV